LLCGSSRALLLGGIAFNVVLFVPPLRALGFHAACAVALYVWIARSLWRDAAAREARAARSEA
jgi:hypothetical protein